MDGIILFCPLYLHAVGAPLKNDIYSNTSPGVLVFTIIRINNFFSYYVSPSPG
jgi:hypothetical protein